MVASKYCVCTRTLYQEIATALRPRNDIRFRYTVRRTDSVCHSEGQRPVGISWDHVGVRTSYQEIATA